MWIAAWSCAWFLRGACIRKERPASTAGAVEEASFDLRQLRANAEIDGAEAGFNEALAETQIAIAGHGGLQGKIGDERHRLGPEFEVGGRNPQANLCGG